MERMLLVGTEDVAEAGRQIAGAAETMRRASGNIDDSLRQHQQFLDDWLQRFQNTLEQAESIMEAILRG